MCVCLLWVSGVYGPSQAEKSAGHKGSAVIMVQHYHLAWEYQPAREHSWDQRSSLHPLNMPSLFIQAWMSSSRLQASAHQGHNVPTEWFQHLLLHWTCPVGFLSTCKRALQHRSGLWGGRKITCHKHGAYCRSTKPFAQPRRSVGCVGLRCRKQQGYISTPVHHWCHPLRGPFKVRHLLLPLSSTCSLQEEGRGRQRSTQQRWPPHLHGHCQAAGKALSPQHVVLLSVSVLEQGNCTLFWAMLHFEIAAGWPVDIEIQRKSMHI